MAYQHGHCGIARLESCRIEGWPFRVERDLSWSSRTLKLHTFQTKDRLESFFPGKLAISGRPADLEDGVEDVMLRCIFWGRPSLGAGRFKIGIQREAGKRGPVAVPSWSVAPPLNLPLLGGFGTAKSRQFFL